MSKPPAWRDYADQHESEVMEEFCRAIANGSVMQKWAAEKGWAYSTFYAWVDETDSRRDMYARARDIRADKLFDEFIEEADKRELTPEFDEDGNQVAVKFDSAAVADKRIRVDARKWALSKMRPGKYGDKLNLDGNLKVDGMTELLTYLSANAKGLPIQQAEEGQKEE